MKKTILNKLTAVTAVCGLALSPVLALADTDVDLMDFHLYDRTEEVLSDWDLEQIECMARNTYYEARSEPVEGQVAVNNVVINRVESERFPDAPCDVVYQRNRRGCQFSWVCQRQYPVRNQEAYYAGYDAAFNVYTGEYEDLTTGAQYYHATYVHPYWANVFKRTTRINLHVFYYEEET